MNVSVIHSDLLVALARKLATLVAIASIGLLLAAPLVVAQSRPRIAILDLVSKDAAEEAQAVAEEVRVAFVKSGNYDVVDRTLTSKIVEEWGTQQSGMTEQEKAVRIGKLYSVKKIVTGRLNKFPGGGWQVSLATLDTETGITTDADTVRYQGNFFALLNDQVPPMARKLAGSIGESPTKAGPMGTLATSEPPAKGPPIAPPLPGPPPTAKGKTWSPEQKLTLAVFPALYTPTAGGGGANAGPWIMDAVSEGIKQVANTEIAYTWYPSQTPGVSLRLDKNLPDRIRGGFLKSLDMAEIKAKIRQLGVDGALIVDGGSTPLVVRIRLVSADSPEPVEQSTGPIGVQNAPVMEAVGRAVQQLRNGG